MQLIRLEAYATNPPIAKYCSCTVEKYDPTISLVKYMQENYTFAIDTYYNIKVNAQHDGPFILKNSETVLPETGEVTSIGDTIILYKDGTMIKVKDYTPTLHECAAKKGKRCDICFKELPNDCITN